MVSSWFSAARLAERNMLLRLLFAIVLGIAVLPQLSDSAIAQENNKQVPPSIDNSSTDTEKKKEQPPSEKATPEPVNEEKQQENNNQKSAEEAEQPEEKNVTAERAPHDDVVYPPVLRDLSALPFPVRRMRELILEAATSGDIEKLRPLIGYGDDVTMLSLGGIEEDPVAFLKTLAGDDEGHEILAILTEVLEAGFVHMDKGTENELYIWPYFVAWPLDKLTPQQRVELYRLVTHGDYQDMESFGAYIFYRLGITPRGRWRFFVAGD